MKYALCLLLLAAPTEPQRPVSPGPWYERLLESINPDNVDYGAIWEERKQSFLDASIRNPYFRYSAWSTGLNVVLLLALFAQHRSHRRSMDVLVQSLADMQAYNDYAREAAREAIRRHNDHIEKCNRVIEASETKRWMDVEEIDAMKAEIQRWKGEAQGLGKDNKRLQQDVDNLSAMIDGAPPDPAGTTRRGEQGGEQSASRPISPEHLERINRLERELNEERKKNERVKGTAIHARDH